MARIEATSPRSHPGAPLASSPIAGVAQRPGRPETVNLTAILADVLRLLPVQRHIYVTVQSTPDLPRVQCSGLGLQNAVLHLALNAREALLDGGVISIVARALPEVGAATEVELSVADNGLGMTPDTMARAFDPFFTTKSAGLGGLGLPMVRRFAEESGGGVEIASEPGLGTTVTLRLPAASAPGDRP